MTSIWTQQAERQQQVAVRALEEDTRLKAQRQAANDADSSAAKELNKVLSDFAANPSAKASCWTLHNSLQLLGQCVATPKTEAVVTAWLTFRMEDDVLLVCGCTATIRAAADKWFKRDHASTSLDCKALHYPLIDALNVANRECTGMVQKTAAPTTVETVVPTPSPTARGAIPTSARRTGTPAAEPSVPPPPPPPPTAAPTEPAVPGIKIRRPKPGAQIYIQVPDSDTKAAIKAVVPALVSAGYGVPAIEVVGDKRAPRCAELRYIYSNDKYEAETLLEDANQEAALKWLQQKDLSQKTFHLEQAGRYQGRALNRVYELWLPSNGGKDCAK